MAHPSPDVAGDVDEPQRMVQRQCHRTRAGGGEGLLPRPSGVAHHGGSVGLRGGDSYHRLYQPGGPGQYAHPVCRLLHHGGRRQCGAGIRAARLHLCSCPADSRGRLPWWGIPAGDEDNCGLVQVRSGGGHRRYGRRFDAGFRLAPPSKRYFYRPVGNYALCEFGPSGRFRRGGLFSGGRRAI